MMLHEPIVRHRDRVEENTGASTHCFYFHAMVTNFLFRHHGDFLLAGAAISLPALPGNNLGAVVTLVGIFSGAREFDALEKQISPARYFHGRVIESS